MKRLFAYLILMGVFYGCIVLKDEKRKRKFKKEKDKENEQIKYEENFLMIIQDEAMAAKIKDQIKKSISSIKSEEFRYAVRGEFDI